MKELDQQRQQTELLDFQYQSGRHDLMQKLNQLLLWSGTLSAGELMEQKQIMHDLFHEEYDLAQQQQQLADEQERLREKISGLQQMLVSVMKKKEKLRSLLSNER
ncbi:hypothetical protein [Morganella sp. GD04133]|uniref:hypothetical protein n=1 Tax=Morganella sp. GD04133 TaxID=2975435 RepID=UPI002449EBF0|nr:hypothetical protein [Morganella sp. GD04133]MDH0354253.1 hypothetical protein [Morganella sp. GD04133]